MKKLFFYALLLTVAATFGFTVNAQQLGPVPVDTTVIIGKLPNGLTYYIRHNEKPKGQADFYIAQKVGSALENDNQRGLAHFLEHMCFNGTDNFPGNSLIDWLETKGVKFGYNLNAYTSIDETVYNISNVPVANEAVVDSCLLILHDWADGLLLAPEEIEKERGVIHQEWRRSMVGQMRILEELLPKIYPNNRYGERLPIGTMEVVDNFPPQALRDYYEAWYRPDQQGIIVVGDIDPAVIEAKIKEVFSPIQMPENAPERVYFPVDDNEGTIYAIGKDKEQKMAIIEMMFKTDATPNEVKNFNDYLLMKYMTHMISSMLSSRLDEMSQDPDAPFASASASYGEFFVSKTKDAFEISGVAKGGDVRPVLEAIYRELLRASRGGFTQGEYERARAEYLSRIEKAYENRNTTESGSYVKEYVRHFIDNEPIPGIEYEYSFLNQIAQMIPVEALNTILPELITNDNRVVLALLPDAENYYFPTDEEIAEVIAKVDAEDIEPYRDAMKEEPLIPALPTPGKVVSTQEVPNWGATEYTLSNGVKVITKKTDYKPNEILFHAIAKGGTSTISDDKASDLVYMPLSMNMHGLGDYTNSDLTKYLQGKQVSVNLSIDDYERELSGNTTVKDLPTMMELIYMNFVGYDICESDFEAGRNMFRGILANQEASPDYQFSKILMENLYKSPAKAALSTAAIDAASREGILNIIHNQVKNAADFTFYFVGDINPETFVPLMEQYIATLPADAANVNTTVAINNDRELTTVSDSKTFNVKMETPQTYVFVGIDGIMPYTPSNKVLSSIASQILSNRLLKKIREEMGAVYSIGARGGMMRLGNVNTVLQIPFPMKPELKNEVLAEIKNLVNDMTENVADSELNPVKEFMIKNAAEDRELNSEWIAAMVGEALNGIDTFNGLAETISAVTTDDVKAFMKEFVGQGNYIEIIVDPAE